MPTSRTLVHQSYVQIASSGEAFLLQNRGEFNIEIVTGVSQPSDDERGILIPPLGTFGYDVVPPGDLTFVRSPKQHELDVVKVS